MKRKQNSKKVMEAALVVLASAAVLGTFPGYAQTVTGESGEPGVAVTVTAVKGWQYRDGFWYFYQLDPLTGRTSGLTGWQWIDGYCYYFLADGRMISAGQTPDGYQVSQSGAWTEQGVVVYAPGKGILTKPVPVAVGRSGGGGGSGSGSSKKNSGGTSSNQEQNLEEEPGYSITDSMTEEQEADGSEVKIDESETNEEFAEGGTKADVAEDSARLRLDEWHLIAREADAAITGIDNPLDQDHLVSDKVENDRRLKSLVSQISDYEYHEFYMIGVNYQPDTLILGQMYRDQFVYSNTLLEVLSFDNNFYTISRIRVKKIQQTIEKEVTEGDSYSYGDIILRDIGGQTYRFRCVDEDYQDEDGNYRKCALFLCDSVIRADVNSSDTEKELLSFGNDNNYKTSKIRQWLNQHASTDEFAKAPVSIGVNYAYGGSTETDNLTAYPIPYQKINDNLFLLSVEEALEYEDVLWCFDGGNEANPESQYSPYSKGYYLRTPMYEADENGDFCYGSGVYIVDLIEESIHPVDVSFNSIGIRPAFTLPNE